MTPATITASQSDASPAVAGRIVPVAALSPAAALSRLIVDKVVEVWPSSRVYWFRKGPERNPTDCAMLIIERDKPTFRVQYYPRDGEPQFAAELGMDKLPAIIEDLAQAGFPVSRQAAPPPRAASPVALEGGTPLLRD